MTSSLEDDDATVRRPAPNPGAVAAWDSRDTTSPAGERQALEAGSRIYEFEIVRQIGEGGFSIVYLAWDTALRRQIALKEYIPYLAVRTGGERVSVRSERDRDTFVRGLESFIKEGQLLAHFQHPSLLKVFRLLEANGTAYMAMPFYEGTTLSETLKGMTDPPDETWLKGLLSPLLEALETLHADKIYHRDIAPDNILLLGSHERPLLLDFGAARRVVGGATTPLTVILKPGYAPLEQYDDAPSMKQGPWTDVYALCAVLYRAIAGHAPVPSSRRALRDSLVPIAQVASGKYSTSFLAAIDSGLAIRPEDRPQDVATLRSKLLASSEVARSPTNQRQGRRWLATGLAGAGALAVGGMVVVLLDGPRSAPANATAPAPVAATASPPGPISRVDHDTKPAPTPAPAPGRAPAVAPAVAFSVKAVLDDIAAHATSGPALVATAASENVVIGKDEIRLRIKSGQSGYLYVLYSGTGPEALAMVFPNAVDKDNQIPAGRELLVPRRIFLKASGPPGDDRLMAVISPVPLEFIGMEMPGSAQSPIGQFDLAALERAWRSRQPETSAFAGVAKCSGGGACPGHFAVATVRVTEVEPGAPNGKRSR